MVKGLVGKRYLSTISVISIFSWFTTFGDFEGGFGNDLVQGVSSSSEDFARVAVASEGWVRLA